MQTCGVGERGKNYFLSIAKVFTFKVFQLYIKSVSLQNLSSVGRLIYVLNIHRYASIIGLKILGDFLINLVLLQLKK